MATIFFVIFLFLFYFHLELGTNGLQHRGRLFSIVYQKINHPFPFQNKIIKNGNVFFINDVTK